MVVPPLDSDALHAFSPWGIVVLVYFQGVVFFFLGLVLLHVKSLVFAILITHMSPDLTAVS